MKDLIEERDRKEKIQRSIIKRWNVHYMTKEELESKQGSLDEAAAIFARLQAEEREDEARKQAEIEAAKRASEGYNATTNSYSGAYGQGEVDTVTKGQIDQILAEKEVMLQNMIHQQAGNDDTE